MQTRQPHAAWQVQESIQATQAATVWLSYATGRITKAKYPQLTLANRWFTLLWWSSILQQCSFLGIKLLLVLHQDTKRNMN